MKKNIIILFCALAGGLSAVQAQLTVKSVYAVDPYYYVNCGEAIVRSWNPSYVVSAFREGSQYYFEVVETGLSYPPNTYKCEAPLDVYVTDMYVADDSLYFCGYMIDGSDMGVIGKFYLDDLVNQPTFDIDYMKIPQCHYFYHIVAYADAAGYYRIVAIGKDPASWDCVVVEVTDVPNGLYDYTIIPTFEWVTNLVLTDNYVALVGGGAGYPDAVTLRVSDRNNVINSGMLDVRYEYPFGTGVPEVSLDLVACSLGADFMAMAYRHEDLGYNFDTRIHVFDLSSMDMVNSISITTADKGYPIDMTYVPDDNSMVLLSYDANMNEMTYAYIEPWSWWPYNTDVTYLPGVSFFSLTTQDNHYYIGGGYGGS